MLCLGCDDVRRPSGGNQPRRDAGPQEDGATASDSGFEVVFAKPWKRQVYFAVVAAVAAIGLVLIIAFT